MELLIRNRIDNRLRGSLAILSIAMIFAAVTGCSTGTPLNVDIAAGPSPVLELSWAKAKRTSQGLVVSGQVQQVHCCAYLQGDIHVEAIGANGLELAATNVPWGEFNPRQLHSAWFKATLPVPPETAVSAIRIQFDAQRD